MSGVSWGTGQVDFVAHDGVKKVVWFENNGVVWYSAVDRIAMEGWQDELDPFEGRCEGYPFDVAAKAKWNYKNS